MKKKIINKFILFDIIYMDKLDNVMDNVVVNKSIEFQNKLLNNDYFRVFFLILVGVFAGYTLQPVPKWLNNLFDKSEIFKFLVLFMVGSVAVHPINKSKAVKITLGAIIVLGLFYLARVFDGYLDNKKKQVEEKKQDEEKKQAEEKKSSEEKKPDETI